MTRLAVREGLALDVDAETVLAVRRSLVALQTALRPRIGFLSGSDALPVVRNLIGSVQVSPDLVLDISPKTEPGTEWTAAVIDLLLDDRVEYGGETNEAEQLPRVVLADALARLFLRQLDFAIRREGPLSLLVQQYAAEPRLRGRLAVTQWATGSLTRPHVFPQHRTFLTVDNDFTRAMAWVAEALAARCFDPVTAERLRHVATRLRPGLPAHTFVDPGVSTRAIPPQWRAYAPAWSTACAVLRRTSPLQRSGSQTGFGFAVEPWPLLERLLLRSLHAAARKAPDHGLHLRAHGHSQHTFLTPEPLEDTDISLARLARSRSVEPDGTLWVGDRVAANFEAKYSRVDSDATFRGHVFQAMTTAAALDSPLAVLVYPEKSVPVVWSTTGFNGRPLKLAAIGLDLFGYRRGAGDDLRGNAILELVVSEVPALRSG